MAFGQVGEKISDKDCVFCEMVYFDKSLYIFHTIHIEALW